MARIKITPNVGPPTTMTTVKGSGFKAGEKVNIKFDAGQLAVVSANSRGRFDKQVQVPAAAKPGKHRFHATGASSGRTASRAFQARTDWSKFGFDSAHSGTNPYENVLDTSNVSGSKVKWSFPTADQIRTSPAVVNGFVYYGVGRRQGLRDRRVERLLQLVLLDRRVHLLLPDRGERRRVRRWREQHGVRDRRRDWIAALVLRHDRSDLLLAGGLRRSGVHRLERSPPRARISAGSRPSRSASCSRCTKGDGEPLRRRRGSLDVCGVCPVRVLSVRTDRAGYGGPDRSNRAIGGSAFVGRTRERSGNRALSGRYELREVIGRGGMATVFRGYDRVLGRTVAVKVLSPPYDGDEAFVARFRTEARAAARLNHPNIAVVFDTGVDGKTRYIVLEYVDGRTLADVLRERRTLPPSTAVTIASSICLALEAAHEQGLVHRDVKPGNVMLTERGEVKVLDFGITKALSEASVTRSGGVLGTASYLSPEQARGLPVDARSDIYSLGCVLYQMLAGTPPFTGDGPVVIASRHATEEPLPLAQLEPRVPSDLQDVVMKALAKDPAARYQSAAEMRDQLQRWDRGAGPPPTQVIEPDRTAVLPPAAPPPAGLSTTGPARRRPGRRTKQPLVAVLVAVLLVLAVIALARLGSSGQPGAASGPTTARRTTTSPRAPSPTPTPTSSRTVSPVAAAVANFNHVIDQGEAQGTISRHAGDELLGQLRDIMHAYQEGKGDDIDHKLQDMKKHLSDLEKHGDVDRSAGEEIRAAIARLRSVLT